MHPQGHPNKAVRSQIPVRISTKGCTPHAKMLSAALSGESKDNSRCTREFSQCGVVKTDPHAGDLREKCSPSFALSGSL